MAADEPSGARPGPIVLRIKLRYDDVEQMVARFAANVGKSGLFLPTRSLQSIGAEIKFELRLADDTPALVGLGRVKSARAPDPQHPRAAFGMAVELMRVTPQSRALILRMLERRREVGLPEVALPSAEDIDAARRAEGVDPMARDAATGPVPVVPRPGAAAAAAPIAAIAPPPPGDALLTAPRRTTGPMSVAKVVAIAPLAPEPPRRRRPAVNEVIERASGPVAAVAVALPGLDDHVDLAATIARARALAGGSLDAELEALSGSAAAPVEISIDAASAELARQLGGSAVRRDRSAGWAPPPATAQVPDAGAVDAEPAHAEPVPRQDASDADDPEQDGAHAAEAGAADAGTAADAAAAAPVEADAADAAEGDAEGAAGGARPGDAAEAGAAQVEAVAASAPAEVIAAPTLEVHALEVSAGIEAPELPPVPGTEAEAGADAAPAWAPSDDDRVELALAELDSDEHTEMGAMPGAAGFELPAEAELGVDDPDLGAPPPDGVDGVDGLDGADDGAGSAEPPLELGIDEFDDFEILAEADASDEDLLASHGEHEASNRRDLGATLGGRPGRPSELDFAARLDLGDESDGRIAAGSSDEFSASHLQVHHAVEAVQDELTIRHDSAVDRRARPDPRSLSADAALAAFEGDDPDAFEDESRDSRVTDDPDAYDRQPVQPIFDPDPSSSFTLAGIPSDSMDYTPSPPHHKPPRSVEPARPVERRAPAPSKPEPSVLRHAAIPTQGGPVEDYELEHALEALDVDLDDLSIPHAATQLQRPARAKPQSSQPPTHAPAPQPRVPAATPPPRAPAATISPRAPAATPAPQPRSRMPTPAPQPRGFAPAPVPPRPHRSTPAPQPRAKVITPSQPPRGAAPTPSRPLGHGASHPARPAMPRAPSDDGVDIDFDDDD